MKCRHASWAALALAAIACLAPALQADTAPSTAVPAAPASGTIGAKLGVNIEETIDYAHGRMFVDAMKSARRFGSADTPWDEKAPLDKDGWPTADAGTCAITALPSMGGTYSFSCTGRADVVIVNSNAQVLTQSYDEKTNKTSAQIKVADEANQLFLGFKNTQGGIKNIKLIRPGYPADTTQTFTNEFLQQLRPFSVIRFMDYTKTNKTGVINWADRPKPTDALQSGPNGACWEYAIQLANETGKDMWVNVPDQATPEYIRELAKLLKAQLKPGRSVYVEYSNEVWNSMFPQFHHNQKAAEAEVKAGDTSLSDKGTDANIWYWGWKRVGKQAVVISKIFREVFGDAAMNKTVRVVLASQSDQPFMLRMQLEYIDKYHGAPSKFLYGVAGAPYMGLPDEINKRNDLTVDQLISTYIPAGVNGWCKDKMFAYTLLARHYKLASLCYEGGPGLEGDASTAAKIEANRDPRLGGLIETYLNNWYSMGGDVFMYYALTGSYSKYGCWGITEDVTKETAKSKAVARLSAQPLPRLVGGYPVPGEIPATKPHLQDGGGVEKGPDGGENIGFIHDGNSFDYVIAVPNAGKYTIKLKTAAQGEGSQVTVSVNGDVVGSISPAGTGDWQKFAESTGVTATLKPGLTTLRLKVDRAGLNLRAIVVQKADGQAAE